MEQEKCIVILRIDTPAESIAKFMTSLIYANLDFIWCNKYREVMTYCKYEYAYNLAISSGIKQEHIIKQNEQL